MANEPPKTFITSVLRWQIATAAIIHTSATIAIPQKVKAEIQAVVSSLKR